MDTTSLSKEGNADGGRIYWFFRNITDGVGRFFARHLFATCVIFLCMAVLLVLFREEWQPGVVFVRRYITPVLIALGIIAVAMLTTRGSAWYKRLIALVVGAALITGAVAVYEYVALWWRYQTLDVVSLTQLPETTGERVQPLSSVHGLANSIMGDSKDPTLPTYVWVKDKNGMTEYRWSMGVEPAFLWDRIFGGVDEVMLVSGTDASPNFSAGTRKVRFATGEGLLLSSNAKVAAIRTFDPLKFLSYEPTDVRYIPNDKGEIVQVISLLRWRGLFVPYPEFGGVLIVHQSENGSSLAGYFKRVFFGEGSWIPPEDIARFPYLRGQNILPYRVSEYIGESLRFKNGFLAPFPGYHQGDLRVPLLPDDQNTMPYAVPFAPQAGLPEMLYHYFALEPYLEGKHGLVASVLIPADGTHRVFVYDHEQKNESLIGVSMVPAIVRDSKKTYNWGKNVTPVEHRPFIRNVGGKTEFAWLTTVVTYNDVAPKKLPKGAKDAKEEDKDAKRAMVTGNIPEVVLTDARTNATAWVDPRDHAGWANALPK